MKGFWTALLSRTLWLPDKRRANMGRKIELKDAYNKYYTIYSGVINRKYQMNSFEQSVFYTLCLYSYDKQYASVAVNTIAKDTLLSRDKVMKVLKELRRKKVIRLLDFAEARKIDKLHPEWKRGKKWGREQNVYELLAMREMVKVIPELFKDIFRPITTEHKHGGGWFKGFTTDELFLELESWTESWNMYILGLCDRFNSGMLERGSKQRVNKRELNTLERLIALMMFKMPDNANEKHLDILTDVWLAVKDLNDNDEVLWVDEFLKTDEENKKIREKRKEMRLKKEDEKIDEVE